MHFLVRWPDDDETMSVNGSFVTMPILVGIFLQNPFACLFPMFHEFMLKFTNKWFHLCCTTWHFGILAFRILGQQNNRYKYKSVSHICLNNSANVDVSIEKFPTIWILNHWNALMLSIGFCSTKANYLIECNMSKGWKVFEWKFGYSKFNCVHHKLGPVKNTTSYFII